MPRLSALLALALAAALSLPSLTYASGAPAASPDARLAAEAGAPEALVGLGGPVTAGAAIEAAVEAEIAAELADTVEVARYATLAAAVAATVTQEAELTPSDLAPGDIFGSSVSLSGDRALVGSYGNGEAGAAYVFAFDDTSWIQEAKLTADDASTACAMT